MTLANPAGLWFLLAALPIIAIHLLKPRRSDTVVSSAMLWEADTVGSTAATPWQRLPPSLLLLLQLLLVGLGALLLADPVVRSEAGLAEHTVVVLDTSASMGSTDGSPDRFSDAQAEAIALVDEIPRGGRVSLVTAGPAPRVRVTSTTDMAAFEAAVRATRLSDGPADLSAALTLADGLETPDVQLGIVIISDGGHTPTQLAALPKGVTHRLVGSSDINHAITALDVRRVTGGIEVTAVSEVTGGGAVSAPLRVDVDGSTQAVIDIEIDPATPTTTRVTVPEGEQVIARLGGDDLLAIDNTAYAITRTQAELRVSLHGEIDPFLDALLSSIPGLTVVDPDVEAPEVSIFVGVPVPEDVVRPFIAIAPSGGVPGVELVGSVENPAVTLVRSADPLLAGLDLSRVRIVEAQRITAPTGEVLVGAEGAPLLVRGRRNGIPFLYQSFLFTDSTLPVDLAFPVLGQRMLEELSGAVTVAPSLFVGDALVTPIGTDVVITSPNGTVRERPAGSGALIADRPGFWTVEPTGGAVRSVAVTLGDSESAIDPLPVAPTDPRPLRPGDEPPRSETSWRWVVALIAIALAVFEFWLSRQRRGVPGWQWRTANILRIAAATAIVAALFGAAIPLTSNDVAAVFVLDRSDSVGRLGASTGLNASQQAAATSPDGARLGVVVAADGERIEQLLVPTDRVTGLSSTTIDGDRSDLASGLRLAGALLPDDAKRRVIVVSDGRATTGDPEAEAEALAERGIVVDYILLEPPTGGDAAVLTINSPSSVDEGAEIPIEVIVESTVEQPAIVTLSRNGTAVTTQDALLSVGNNRLTFRDAPGDSGLASYSVTVDTSGDVRPQNDTARTTVDVDGPATVLVVEGTDQAGDILVAALESGGLNVDVVAATALPGLEQLIGYDSTVLVDVSIDQLSSGQTQALVTATRELGRGLVTIGGPQSYGMGGYRNSELEAVLPVISDVLDPQRQRKVAQVMALDTSESMGECHCAENQAPNRADGGVNKTAIARAGAARAIATLNDNDEVGVLAIDTQERWLIDLQQLPSDDVIDAGLAKAIPSGNTDLSGTLPEAADALRTSDASLKHIILFTDGFTSQASLAAMRNQAAESYADGITISVVATGEGAATELRKIAEAGGGRFYPGRDLTRIPEILVQESVLASRQFINEGEFLPIVTDSSPVVDSLTESPALLGFVATTSKATARTSLRIGPEEDPLLASWQVGLGRATSWTSDANARWSQFWTGWGGYVDFWTTVVRDTFPVESTGAVRTTVDGDTLTVRAEADPGAGRLDALVSGPDGAQSTVRLREVAPGQFEAEIAADSAGTYAVAVNATADGERTVVGSNLASVSYAAEYQPGPADESLLRRISEAGGGRGAIDPSQAFDDTDLVAGRRSIELAGWFLLFAVLAWLAAAVLSRLWVSRTRGAPSVPADAQPTQLKRSVAESVTTGASASASSSPSSPSSEAAYTGPATVDRDGVSDQPVAAAPEPAPTAETAPAEPASSATINELLRQRRNRDR